MTTNKEKFSFIIKKDKKIKDNQIQHPPNTEISDKEKAFMHIKKNCMPQYNDYSFEDKMKPSLNNVLLNNNLNSENAINQKDELGNLRKSNLNSNDYEQQLVNTNISEYSDSNSVKSQPNQLNLSNAYFLHENTTIRDKDNAMLFNTNNLQISNNFMNSMNQKVQSNKHIMNDLNNKEQQGLKPSSSKERKNVTDPYNTKEDNSKGMINNINRSNQLTVYTYYILHI